MRYHRHKNVQVRSKMRLKQKPRLKMKKARQSISPRHLLSTRCIGALWRGQPLSLMTISRTLCSQVHRNNRQLSLEKTTPLNLLQTSLLYFYPKCLTQSLDPFLMWQARLNLDKLRIEVWLILSSRQIFLTILASMLNN